CKASVEYSDDRTRIERKILGDTSTTITRVNTPKGQLRNIDKRVKSQPWRCVEPFIKEDKDIEKFLSLSVESSIPDLSLAKELYNEIDDKGLLYLKYKDPFSSVARLFDFQEFTIKCIQELSLIKELIDREFERVRIQLNYMLNEAEGYDFLFHTDGPELATPPMLPPAIFRQLITPYQHKLVKMIKEAGHLSSIHCHGKVRKVFHEFLVIENDILEPLEPPPQGDITLKEALDRADGRMSLMGYIQDQDLYTSTPGEIRKKVRLICRLVRGKIGYIMSTTATPYMFPPPERFVRNYIEFVEAAAEYGTS
ncbi:hypothetical protein KAV79_02865, partial [Candidatus Aerophobetes bacterium]|nr:hypothetical protein [Candidatus Aerophobetes bacterium]